MTAPLIVDRLTKRYGSLTALQDMSFTVAPGEIFGFVGSNGAGKSTTMRIILGVLGADSGQVRLGDRPIDLDLRRRIGYMPEERGLYPKMKVGKQLSFLAQLHGLSRAEADDQVETWVRRLGIHERINDDVNNLSLGNQQRVQLAAALVHNPDVLVLDEPFSGLDPVAVDVMSDVLKEKAAQGVPVIFSSHQLELVQRLCDRVGIITKGTMRALGTVDDLRSTGEIRLDVGAPAAPSGWADHLPGVQGTIQRGALTTVSLTPGTDEQGILAAALATGPVTHFALSKPDLTELFREVVSA
ncbi:MAG: ABC transporter ATP-binding protein [Gordonia sp.]|uniref:ATP-binding cassette domain-containing protein n=1 Tax=Gordonia rubripertincta TaxID=36822 RepID=A0ABT4N2K6_GORRU|nr:ATP-binding cassette domain-containing protein [Gordonia rubripertincta]MBA4024490.1 ABC transporter ATP-binding protein [Gordonia sp. (in: high G+C Gram-positive bacteria)]MCZ4553515.1 ATP-binding cassette domain-containing protein [Gordonia rubripertincta]